MPSSSSTSTVDNVNLSDNEKVPSDQEHNLKNDGAKLNMQLKRKNSKLKSKIDEMEMELIQVHMRTDTELKELRWRLVIADVWVMTLETQLNDPDNVHMESTVQALKLHETFEDLKKFLKYVMMNLDEVYTVQHSDSAYKV